MYKRCKLSRCSFLKKIIHYLDCLVSGTSILPLADKIKPLMKFQPPINVKDIRHFLGLTGYYCTFISNYADIAYLLNCLTCKALPFVWTPVCQASFNMLQSRYTNTLILPDPNKLYLLFLDANFVVQVCLPKHPLQNSMKHL